MGKHTKVSRLEHQEGANRSQTNNLDEQIFNFVKERLECISQAKPTSLQAEAIIFFVGFNIGAYVMPLGIICVLYIMMVRSLWRSKEGLKVSKEAFK